MENLEDIKSVSSALEKLFKLEGVLELKGATKQLLEERDRF